MIEPGLFKHYKGNMYRLLTIAKHSETLEEMAVYQALYGNQEFWVRPLAMFCETVVINGAVVLRFERVEKSKD